MNSELGQIDITRMLDILLGKEGSSKRQLLSSKVAQSISEVAPSPTAYLKTAVLCKALAAHSSDELSVFTIDKMGIGKFLIPYLTIENDWHAVLANQIGEATLDDVLLPFKHCIVSIAVGDNDKRVYKAIVRQNTPEEKIDIDFFAVHNAISPIGGNEDVELTDEEHEFHYQRFKKLLVYGLLASEVNLAENVSTRDDKRNADDYKPALPGKVDTNAYRGISHSIVQMRKSNGGNQSTHAPGGKKRLHIRRAHWRTYADGKKVRISWMLVGDINLGFISKDYAV